MCETNCRITDCEWSGDVDNLLIHFIRSHGIFYREIADGNQFNFTFEEVLQDGTFLLLGNDGLYWFTQSSEEHDGFTVGVFRIGMSDNINFTLKIGTNASGHVTYLGPYQVQPEETNYYQLFFSFEYVEFINKYYVPEMTLFLGQYDDSEDSYPGHSDHAANIDEIVSDFVGILDATCDDSDDSHPDRSRGANTDEFTSNLSSRISDPYFRSPNATLSVAYGDPDCGRSNHSDDAHPEQSNLTANTAETTSDLGGILGADEHSDDSYPDRSRAANTDVFTSELRSRDYAHPGLSDRTANTAETTTRPFNRVAMLRAIFEAHDDGDIVYPGQSNRMTNTSGRVTNTTSNSGSALGVHDDSDDAYPGQGYRMADLGGFSGTHEDSEDPFPGQSDRVTNTAEFTSPLGAIGVANMCKDDILELFICPVCFDYIKRNARFCRNNHFVCNGCFNYINQSADRKCPTCRGLFPRNSRCDEVEKLLQSMKFPGKE